MRSLLALILVALLGGLGLLLFQLNTPGASPDGIFSPPSLQQVEPLESGEEGLSDRGELANPDRAPATAQRGELRVEPVAEAAPAAPKRPQPEDFEDPTLFGRVVDEYGKPLEGAEIICYAIPAQASELRGTGMVGFQRELMKRGKKEDSESGEDGAFRLKVPSMERELELEVKLRGHVAASIQVGRPAELPHDVGDIPLQLGCVITGRVVDQGNQPLRRASVRIERESDEDPMGLAALGFDSGGGLRTEKDGRFEFPHEPAGDFELLITHDDHPDLRHEGTAQLGEVIDLTLALEAGGVIAGRVDDIPEGARGLIVQARKVRTQVAADEEDSEEGGGMLGAVFEEMGMSTGEHWARVRNGEFELTGLDPDGVYAVWAAAPNRQLFLREPVTPEQEVGVGDTEVVLVYEQGAILELRVVDASTGEPVEELEVFSKLSSGRRLPARREDVKAVDGVVRLTNLRPEKDGAKLELMLRATGYQSYKTETVIAATGEQGMGSVFLQPMPTIDVLVVDGRGRPVEGASVWLSASEASLQELVMASEGFGNMSAVDLDEEDDTQPRGGETDEEGELSLNSMPGVEAALTVRAEGFALHRELVQLPAGGDFEHEVTLSAGGGVRITVVDSSGFAAEKARVEHRADEGLGGQGGNFTADANGQVLLESLTPGLHRLRAKPPGITTFGGPRGPRGRRGGMDDEEDWVEVQVIEGELVDLELQLPLLAVLAGVVTQGGRELADVKLMLLPFDPDDEDRRVVVEGMETFMAVSSDTSDERGAYRMADVPVGSYELTLRHPDRAMPTRTRVEVVDGETQLDVELDLTAVRGRVIDGKGNPVAGARVSALPASEAGSARVGLGFLFGGQERSSVQTDGEGYFELGGLEAEEELVLRAEARMHSPDTTEKFTLRSGELRDDFELSLQAGGALVVQLDGPGMFTRVTLNKQVEVDPEKDGPVLDTSGLTEIGSSLPSGGRRVAVSRRGKAEFDDLEPGVWVVWVDGENRGSVAIEEGEEARLRVELTEEED